MVVYSDYEGLFQQVGRYGCKFPLLYDIYAHEFGSL